jgi:8-oxo-dGTP pyrophosphatase MutT (NUDIX family)
MTDGPHNAEGIGPTPTDRPVFTTPWFRLIERHTPGGASSAPHYCIDTKDYCTVVALTAERRLLLVRQYRPAVRGVTLELPSGHVEPGQTPAEAARTELIEETGHDAERFTLLGNLVPDTGRMANRMWCFWAEGVRPVSDPGWRPEAGMEVVTHPGPLSRLVLSDGFDHALNMAALLLATLSGRLPDDFSAVPASRA